MYNQDELRAAAELLKSFDNNIVGLVAIQQSREGNILEFSCISKLDRAELNSMLSNYVSEEMAEGF